MPDELDNYIRKNGKYHACTITFPFKCSGISWNNIKEDNLPIKIDNVPATFESLGLFFKKNIGKKINTIYNNSGIKITTEVLCQKGCLEVIVTFIIELLRSDISTMKAFICVAGLILGISIYSGSNIHIAHIQSDTQRYVADKGYQTEEYKTDKKYQNETDKRAFLLSLLNQHNIKFSNQEMINFSEVYLKNTQEINNTIYYTVNENPVIKEITKLPHDESNQIELNTISVTKEKTQDMFIEPEESIKEPSANSLFENQKIMFESKEITNLLLNKNNNSNPTQM